MAKTDFTARVTAKLAGLTVGNAICGTLTGKLIANIQTRGATMDVDMHSAAVAALTLSSLHRDANAAALLLNAMPKGSRAATLALWFETFGNIVVTAPSKDKPTYRCKMKLEKDCVPVDLDKAQATPFWTKQETVSGAFDDAAFSKALASLIKRAESDKASLSPATAKALATLKVAKVELPEVANA